MINYTVQEIRRFYYFIIEQSQLLTQEFILASSTWRRQHQYLARIYHYKNKINLQL
jgi:hypothetical protein